MKLLEHFKELTTHPKNAQELKGLILQLAIEGKLTNKWREENPDLADAGDLIDRIRSSKKELIKKGLIKKGKIWNEILENEILIDVPETWRWIRLGEYTHSFGQKEPDEKFKYIDVGSIDNKKGKIKDDLSTINPDDAPSRARKIVKKGCVIFSTVRPYLQNIAILEFEHDLELIASTAFAILNPIEGCSEYYLFLLLRSSFFMNYVDGCMKGVAYPAINDENLLNAPIPVPPLEEQKAIIAVVEELFKEVEELELKTKERIRIKEDYVSSALQQLANGDTEAEWPKIQEHFKTFFTEKSAVKKLRETILQLAVQGKLTKHWRSENPNQEHAKVLLAKIKAEKAQLIKDKKIKPEKPLPPIKKEEIPYELPEGWVWCRLGDIGEFINGDRGKNYPNKSEYLDEGIAWINTGHINPNGFLSKTRMNYISIEKFNSLRSGKIQEGDLVYCLRGATFGKTAFVKPFNKGAIASSLMIIRNYLKFTSDYTYRFLISPEGRRQLLRFDNGSAQPNLSANKVKLYLFPLPPEKEQIKIINKIDSLMHLCDELDKEIEQNTDQVEALMKSCVREVLEF